MKNLNANDAEHLVIGGFAVNHYDKEREPHDIDILISPKGDNPYKVAEALNQSRFDGLDVALATFDFANGRWVTHLTHPETGIQLDVLTNVSGSQMFGGFDNAHKNAVTQTVEGIEYKFPSLDHLTINKIASWGEEREKDIADARRLLDLSREMTRQQDRELEAFQTKFRALCDKVAEKERGPEPERAEKAQQTTSKPEKQQESKPTQEQDRDWGHEW